MKKLFLLFFGLTLTVNVQAKTYYSKYTEFKESDIKIEESDIVKTKTEDKYLIYKENKIEAFYPSYMEIEDMTKTNETKIEVSDWLDEKPNELIGRNIIEKGLYEYQNMKKIKYIKINNKKISISELNILNGSKKIEYEIKEGIIIELKEEIDINDLKIELHIKNTETPYKLELYGEEFKNVYAYALNNSLEYIDKEYFELESPLYEEKVLSETEIKKNKFNIVNLVTKYKTEDLYIKYEKIEREYLEDYFLEPIEGYKLDLDTKKEFYYIRTRDKVEIKDNLIIDNYNTKLEDFIISTTVDNIKITSNMNYHKNGEYDINFILPFKTVKEKLKVNILENYTKALQVQNNYLKQLEIENNKLIISNNKLNTEIKEILQNKDKSINEVNNKIIECRYELQELKSNKQELGEELIDEKDYKILIIIPIILILLLILFFLRKKSIQNNN